MQAPEDIEDPTFAAKRSAYQMQRRLIHEVADAFAKENFRLKTAFKMLLLSDFYRLDGTTVTSSDRDVALQAAMDDLGVVRLLGPEQLKRKLSAIFGKTWDRLDGEMKILYGGIDSITVTERNTDPSGAMGAIQRIMANDVACYHVARDFRLNPADRKLFPANRAHGRAGRRSIGPSYSRSNRLSPSRLLGDECSLEHPEVARTFELFQGILRDVQEQGKVEPRETYFCGGREEFNTPDPKYTIRAWRGVVTYLLRQHAFLYE